MKKLNTFLIALCLLALPIAGYSQGIVSGENGKQTGGGGPSGAGIQTIAQGGTNTGTASAGTVPNATSASASSWTATPTLGVAATTAGTLALANGSGGGAAVTIDNPATTVAYSYHLPSNAGAIGALLTSGNTSQQVWLSDAATGQVLTSAGATTIPAYSATPQLGVSASQAGTLGLANGAGGGLMTTLAGGATANWTLTFPVNVPGTSGMVLSATTGGVSSWLATEAHLGNAGAYGNNTNFPTNNIIVQAKAANAGHFTQLVCNNQSLNAGSCTTAPTVNVFDVTTAGVAPLLCSTTAQNTLGTTTVGAQTRTFAAGDIIGIFVSTQGGTCLAPTFSVDATLTYP